MNFAFAGTPRLGAWVLRDLLERGRVPSLVISQPDRPAGRGRRSSPPPVVEEAARHGLPVHQTANINDDASLRALRESGAQALVVAAFGHLVRRQILDEFLCLNVHASLLPLYRGAAPIVRALMDGCSETGVAIMRMSPGLDEGPWAQMTKISVSPRDDAGSLSRGLALLGAVAMDQVLTGSDDGTLTWTEQQGEPTYARKLEPRDRFLDPAQSVQVCHDRVRALSPEIGCEARTAGGLELKIWRTWVRPPSEWGKGVIPASPGTAGELAVGRNRIFLACADGWLELLSLQPSGKKAMAAGEFLRGYERRLGGRLLPPPEPESDQAASNDPTSGRRG